MDVNIILEEIRHYVLNKKFNITRNERILMNSNDKYKMWLVLNPKKSIGLDLIVFDKLRKQEELINVHSIRDVFAKNIYYFGKEHNVIIPEPLLSLYKEYSKKNSDIIRVTVAGSYRGERFEKMKKLVQKLKTYGIEIYYPKEGELDDSQFGFFESDETKDPLKSEFEMFASGTIAKCDAAIFCDYDGHLGEMSSNELYAFAALSYVPCYLLEPFEEFDSSLLESMKEIGTLKIGLEQFYKDFGIVAQNDVKKMADHEDDFEER